MSGPRVLVVEDDGAIADAVLHVFRKDGMETALCGTLAAARDALLSGVDLVILDLGLPDGSGFSLLGEIRALPEVPRVIVLTSRDEDVDCVAALEAGADDFVAKPFSPRALVARARAVLRRNPLPLPKPVAHDDIARATGVSVDEDRRSATYAGRDLALTKIEFDLLAVLAEAPGRVRTREHLVRRIWGEDYSLTERTVDSHLKGLRRKLDLAGAPPLLLETVRGVGFKMRELA